MMKQTNKNNLVSLNKFKCILAFNDSTECYLFKSEKAAKKEAKEALRNNEIEASEAYICELKINKVLKLKLMEE